jgi:hypothetical protein
LSVSLQEKRPSAKPRFRNKKQRAAPEKDRTFLFGQMFLGAMLAGRTQCGEQAHVSAFHAHGERFFVVYFRQLIDPEKRAAVVYMPVSIDYTALL